MMRDAIKVSVDKNNLLQILKKNREQHESDYIKAKAGFKEELKAELEEKLRLLSIGEDVPLHFENRRPENNLKDYDEIIGMLEISVDESIELTAEQYRCYVDDNWSWKEMWSLSNSAYLSKS